jgi:hypothetical protein
VLGAAFRTGVPFGIVMTVVYSLQRGWRAGVMSGAFAGLAFGLVMAGFLMWQTRRMMVRGESLDGERILYQGAANHWRGREARGGWLVLTERALVFRAHGVNMQKTPVRIELSTVKGVVPCHTLGIVPNGLRVERVDGVEERFVLNGRGEWARRIGTRIGAA